MADEVATIDLDSGASEEALGLQLRRALEETGFVVLTRVPGLNPELLGRAYGCMKRLFDLPRQFLLEYERPDIHHQRGYTPMKVEKAVGAPVADLKHHFFVGPEGAGVQHPNVWPERDVPGFRGTFTATYAMFQRIAYQVTWLLGLATDLRGIEAWLDGSESLLRLIDYPEIAPGEDPRAVRSAAHADINFLTFLPTATAPGLQVLATDGNWIEVNAEPGSLIVNAGDVLEYVGRHRLPEDKRFLIPSTRHQVVNVPGRRFSMPFFSHLHPKYVVNPATGLTERDLVLERLRAIGLAAA